VLSEIVCGSRWRAMGALLCQARDQGLGTGDDQEGSPSSPAPSQDISGTHVHTGQSTPVQYVPRASAGTVLTTPCYMGVSDSGCIEGGRRRLDLMLGSRRSCPPKPIVSYIHAHCTFVVSVNTGRWSMLASLSYQKNSCQTASRDRTTTQKAEQKGPLHGP